VLSSPKRPLLLPVSALAFLAIVSRHSSAADQPQWGEHYSRNMVSTEIGLPDSCDPGTGANVKWTVPLGAQTYSTPIVAGGKVLIGTNNEPPRDARRKGDRTVLLCLNEADGSSCWQLVALKRGGDPYLDWPNVGICSPPTVDGDRVYVVSTRGEVLCLDLNGQANGNQGFQDERHFLVPPDSEPLDVSATDADVLWVFDMVKEVGVYTHDSAHTSILIDGQCLYANTGNGVDNTHRAIRAPEAPSLIVLDKGTGRLVARDGEGIGPRTFHCTWSSPALAEVAGHRAVFYGGADGVCYAFDAWQSAATDTVGKLTRLWRFDCDPTAPKEHIHQYVGNRREGPSTINSMPVYHDGRLYVAAGGDVWWGKTHATLKCLDVASAVGDAGPKELWSYALDERTCSTPAVYNGLVFLADCGGRVHCLDADTGQPCWVHEAGAEIWGSTLVADGKVYVGTHGGELCTLAASKEKKVLATVKLDSMIHGTPTAANGVLYVATMKQLYALAVTR